MAAAESFESFLESLPQNDREALKEVIQIQRDDLFAARSEEARVRIVNDFIKEAHDRLRTARH